MCDIVVDQCHDYDETLYQEGNFKIVRQHTWYRFEDGTETVEPEQGVTIFEHDPFYDRADPDTWEDGPEWEEVEPTDKRLSAKLLAVYRREHRA